MTGTMPDYETRRRQILDRLRGVLSGVTRDDFPASLLDQADAATRDVKTTFDRLARHPRVTDEIEVDRRDAADVRARVLAAMADGHKWAWCPHLRAAPAQPTHVRMPLRRLDCARCARTGRIPPAADADRCDLCGSRGHDTFWPLGLQMTYWLIIGDICQDCALALGMSP